MPASMLRYLSQVVQAVFMLVFSCMKLQIIKCCASCSKLSAVKRPKQQAFKQAQLNPSSVASSYAVRLTCKLCGEPGSVFGNLSGIYEARVSDRAVQNRLRALVCSSSRAVPGSSVE